jgi:predicted ATPase/DNA-binding XRE family transcriptional regulator
VKKANEAKPNDLLRAAREAQGLSPKQVAELIGCDTNMYYRWERGTIAPSPHYREKLCEVLKKENPEELGILPRTHTPKSPAATTYPPMRLPPLIGRDEAIAEVCDLLQNSHTRLLTLTGAPGIGKTQLALHTAKELHDKSAFADGVFTFMLETISEIDRDLIVTVIARKLGLEVTGEFPLLERLKTHLHDKRLLLVLDNCEHLIQVCAELAETLLRSCPNLTLLTTSTELLRIEEEIAWTVPPLRYPAPSHLLTSECLRTYSAIQLFEMRRRKVLPGFTVTDANAFAVAQICACLDGHTLAIRLAAGVDTLSVQQIVDQLDNCLPLLVGGNRTGEERHETMQKTIEWRYSLLSQDEKILLQRLSVFRGGWTQEAAKVVCSGEGLEADAIPGTVLYLRKKSLIDVEKHGKAARTRLLETIRQYAYGQLCKTGKAEITKRRHLEFFLHMVEETRVQAIQEPISAYKSLEVERQNLWAALEWCLLEVQEDSAKLLLHLAAQLGNLWYLSGDWKEARFWLSIALAKVDKTGDSLKHTEEYAVALRVAAMLALTQNDRNQAESLFEKSMMLYRELGNEEDARHTQALHTMVHNEKEGLLAMSTFFEEQSILHPELHDELNSATVLFNNGRLAVMECSLSKARSLFGQALKLFKKAGYQLGATECLYSLGITALLEEKYKDAAIFCKKSLIKVRQLSQKERIADILQTLGYIMLFLENNEEAMEYFKESIELSSIVGNMRTYMVV